MEASANLASMARFPEGGTSFLLVACHWALQCGLE
jgi:hypothetical protein